MSTSVDTGAEGTLSTIVACGGERVTLQLQWGYLVPPYTENRQALQQS